MDSVQFISTSKTLANISETDDTVYCDCNKRVTSSKGVVDRRGSSCLWI